MHFSVPNNGGPVPEKVLPAAVANYKEILGCLLKANEAPMSVTLTAVLWLRYPVAGTSFFVTIDLASQTLQPAACLCDTCFLACGLFYGPHGCCCLQVRNPSDTAALRDNGRDD